MSFVYDDDRFDMCNALCLPAEKWLSHGWLHILALFLHLGFKYWRLDMSSHENPDTKEVSGKNDNKHWFVHIIWYDNNMIESLHSLFPFPHICEKCYMKDHLMVCNFKELEKLWI